MLDNQRHTLSKAERISGKLTIESLFSSEHISHVSYPIRVIYKLSDNPHKVTASILVSVSKKRLHHAVDRNRMKRQIREAYRLNKQIVTSPLTDTGKHLAMAFLFIGDKPCETETVTKSIEKLLQKVAAKI